MTVRRSIDWIYRGVFYLAAGLIYAAILMRTFLLYRDSPVLGQVLGLLLLFLALFLAELALARREGAWFQVYVVLQTILTTLLMYGPNFEEYDYFSLLFAVLGMQVMRKLRINAGVAWIVAFLILIGYKFIRFEEPLDGPTRLLLFGAVIVFLAAYSLAARRAQEGRSYNLALMQQLQEANQKLEQYSHTLEQLGVARERQRMARELHDSVTQTIFSMTLTTQSALILQEKDPSQLGTQLERLNQLTQGALEEMHTLISELRPEQSTDGGLPAAIRQHIDNRHLPEGLSVSLEVDGAQGLHPSEVQSLYRIIQEALNNVVKHAQATRVHLRLHMEEPYWIEIEDDGKGFNIGHSQGGGRIGLAGMRERAEEIGWDLNIQSGDRQGTRVRVAKKQG